jgi:hypothetical protein
MSATEQALSEFIDAWNAGRRPRVRDYLARVPEGPERDALAEQITTWLEIAPTPGYDESARAQIRADPVVRRPLTAAEDEAGLWPAVMPELRARAGLTVGRLATRLVERFRLAPDAEPRVAEYLACLERGELEPRRVSRRMLDALDGLLGLTGGSLTDVVAFGGGLRPSPAGGAIFRAEAAADEQVVRDIEAVSRAAMSPAPPAMDEVDRLFTGGPDG